ncbi:hypothetical protein O71_13079 [Pontibacter sp. BAB1700]|nr:hypothetical protein O71_13079 [Pontibacter sp. BAB1700]
MYAVLDQQYPLVFLFNGTRVEVFVGGDDDQVQQTARVGIAVGHHFYFVVGGVELAVPVNGLVVSGGLVLVAFLVRRFQVGFVRCSGSQQRG